MSMELSASLFEQRMAKEYGDRLARYKEAWEYYNGNHDKSLAVKTGQADDNVTINLARLIVDKGAAFLFGKEPTFELQEGEATAAEEALGLFWQANRKMTLLNSVALMGGIYGDVFIKIIPQESDPPRLVNLMPQDVRAFTEPDDIEAVYRYVIQFTSLGKDGKALTKRQKIEREDNGTWMILNKVSLGAGKWEADPDNPDVSWGYQWAPIFHAQNLLSPGSYYGFSDLEDVSEQDAINYIASKVQRILRFHAHPKTIGKDFKPGDLETNEDDVLILPSATSDLFNLEMQSDLSAALTFMDRLTNWYLATSRIPRIDPAVINVGSLSGFALRVLYGDLLEKTNVKQKTYGDMLIDLNRRVLELGGQGEENMTRIHWPDPLPEDERATVEGYKFDLDYQVASVKTIRSRRGYDQNVEEERIQNQEVAQGNIGAQLVRNFNAGQQTGIETQ